MFGEKELKDQTSCTVSLLYHKDINDFLFKLLQKLVLVDFFFFFDESF